MSWFNYEKQEKSYKPFDPTKENVKANVGKLVTYICRSDVDRNRGLCFPKFGRLAGRKYSQLIFEDGGSIDARNLIEIAIKIDEESQ